LAFIALFLQSYFVLDSLGRYLNESGPVKVIFVVDARKPLAVPDAVTQTGPFL
jgi:hypothetical protein